MTFAPTTSGHVCYDLTFGGLFGFGATVADAEADRRFDAIHGRVTA